MPSSVLSTSATSSASSWADCVRGAAASVATAAQEWLKPGVRKARTCPCSGILLVMLGNYGWIQAEGDIDHPEASRNGGRVFVHSSDMSSACVPGDRVKFYLYVDEQGIGAEDCLPAEEATPPAAVSFDMQSFPSLSRQRDEQLQSSPADTAGQQKCSLEPEASLLTSEIISWPNPGVGMRATAPEFVPLQSTSLIEPGAPQQQLHQQLPAPSADVSSEDLFECLAMQTSPGNVCHLIDELFSDGSDDEDEPDHQKKATADGVSNRSTESGDDYSEETDGSLTPPITPPPGLEAWGPRSNRAAFQPPPGLSHPSCSSSVPVSPPPGLTKPAALRSRKTEFAELPPWRRPRVKADAAH